MLQTQSIKQATLVLLFCVFSLSACSKKNETTENSSATTPTSATQQSAEKPVLDERYKALYAKSKGNVTKALA